MRLDDSWKRSYETYLNLWSHKVLDLEKIENNTIPDSTKRLWLTTTLQEHKDMKNAIAQATTTEHTLIGMGAVQRGSQLAWERFYDMLIANAKLLDD